MKIGKPVPRTNLASPRIALWCILLIISLIYSPAAADNEITEMPNSSGYVLSPLQDTDDPLPEEHLSESGEILAKISVSGSIDTIPFPIYAHILGGNGEDYVLVRASGSGLNQTGLPYTELDPYDRTRSYAIARYRLGQSVPDITNITAILYDDGKNLVLRTDRSAGRALLNAGLTVRWLDHPIVIGEPVLSAANESAVTYDPRIAAMVVQVRTEDLNQTVCELSGEVPAVINGSPYTFLTRMTDYAEPITMATAYGNQELTRPNLSVSYENWTVGGYSSRSVIATLPGTTRPEEIVLVTAHVDSYSETARAPGADDNASGSAAVLAFARIMDQYRFERTIRFVLFTGEEQGLYGSGAYAAAAAARGETIVAVVNMDMIAWSTSGMKTMEIHTRLPSDTGGYTQDMTIASTLNQSAALYGLRPSLNPVILSDGDEYSDHSSFWARGYPAVVVYEDWISDPNPFYHTDKDLRSGLNMNYFTSIAQVCLATTAHLAVPVDLTGTALIPGHTGPDYTFNGTYNDGTVIINQSGTYSLTQNLTTSSEDAAIRITGPGITLNGNQAVLTGEGQGQSGIEVISSGIHATVRNFSSISGFHDGISSDGDYATISDCTVHDNRAVGIRSYGNYTHIKRNFAFNQGDVGILSWGHYSDVVENYVSDSRNGILSQGNFANITGNAGNSNRNYGIYAGGMYTGPDPGEEGHGYYPRLTENVAILNSIGGIACSFPHAVIRDNSVFQNQKYGITLGSWSNNTTISDNYLSDNPVGIMIPDSLSNISVTGNLIRSEELSGVFIRSGSGAGSGAIYNNIISGDAPVTGNGSIGLFSWTNPSGPTPGTSIMHGPFVAGNFWTNENDTGWSDLQPGNPSGYTTIPCPVAPGVYDTAPLVRVKETPTPTPVPLIANFSANPVTGAPPLPVQFTDLTSGSPTGWRWNFGDGTRSTLQNPIHVYGGIGRYTVTLEVENRESQNIIRKTAYIRTAGPKR